MRGFYIPIGLITAIILINGCIQESEPTSTTSVSIASSTIPEPSTTVSTVDEGGLEVHEWGVLAGCSANDSYFLTSRPKQVLMVREPVIYIHSKDMKPFTVEVRFCDGKPTDTYPKAEVDGDSVVWRDVGVEKDCRISKARGVGGYVPLKSIIETLNDVDADCLDYKGKKTRFLFYEGEMGFENRVNVSYSFVKQTATFINNGGYSVHNLIIAASKEGSSPFNPDVYVGRIDELKPGETAVVEFVKHRDVVLETDLVTEGFTGKEAKAFSNLWKQPFFYPSNTGGWANLIYRLPQEEYDCMITLDVNPEPRKVIRSLYVLIHLNE